jgi:hypothetical protein
MKTKTFHATNMGRFAPTYLADGNGYITIHDSTRYQQAKDQELAEWRRSSVPAIRAAAIVELAEREIQRWRAGR